MNNKLFCTAQCGGACITRQVIDMSKIQKATHDSKLNHIEITAISNFDIQSQ